MPTVLYGEITTLFIQHVLNEVFINNTCTCTIWKSIDTNTIIHTIFYTFKKSKHEGLVTVSPWFIFQRQYG